MRKLRIVLAGGGTGGHIYPIIAVVRQLKALSPTSELRFMGSTIFGTEEMANEGIEISSIIAGKIPRYLTPKLLVELIKIPIGFLMAFGKLFCYSLEVVFGKGGYGVLPSAVKACLYIIPVIIMQT